MNVGFTATVRVFVPLLSTKCRAPKIADRTQGISGAGVSPTVSAQLRVEVLSLDRRLVGPLHYLLKDYSPVVLTVRQS
jgi:hypothetical protein